MDGEEENEGVDVTEAHFGWVDWIWRWRCWDGIIQEEMDLEFGSVNLDERSC